MPTGGGTIVNETLMVPGSVMIHGATSPMLPLRTHQHFAQCAHPSLLLLPRVSPCPANQARNSERGLELHKIRPRTQQI